MPALFSALKGNSKDPMAVSSWVMENVPCFKGPVPQDWTQAVYYEASVRHVPPWALSFALSLTRKYGYQFTDITSGNSRRNPVDLVGVPITRAGQKMLGKLPQQYNALDAADRRDRSIGTMKYLDFKFSIASSNHDGPEMLRLAQEFANLLNAARPGELSEVEIVHGAPLIRRAIEPIKWDGRALREDERFNGRNQPRERPSGEDPGGGPYRVASWVESGEIDEETDGEAE
jgi:hypothetical protein